MNPGDQAANARAAFLRTQAQRVAPPVRRIRSVLGPYALTAICSKCGTHRTIPVGIALAGKRCRKCKEPL